MKNNQQQIVIAVFLGNIALSEAIKLNRDIPDYWHNGYSDTWEYTGKPRYVNATEWEESDPADTHDVAHAAAAVQLSAEIPDYWANGYSDTWEYTGKPHYVNETQWVEDEPKDFVVAQQSGQLNGYPADKTPVSFLESKEFEHRQAWTGDQHDASNEAQYKSDTPGGYVTLQMQTPQGIQPVKIPNNLSQKKTQNYDHLHEQESWIEPYVTRAHSWNIPELNQSDEHKWDTESKAIVAADSAAGDYDETNLPVSSNWSRNQYYNEPGYGAESLAQGQSSGQGQIQNRNKNYDHLHEQESWIEPYVTRAHSWNIPELNQSDEHKWDTESKAIVAADSAAGDYDETGLPVSSNWSRNQYYNEPGYGAESLAQGQASGQASGQGQNKYDHLHEQESWIEPYVTRAHSWNIPEMNQSDEHKWDAESKAIVAADSAAGDYDETNLPVSSNWSRNQYYNEPGYGAESLAQSQAQYDHLNEQESWIEPYTVRAHSWNIPELNQSDEHRWDNESKAIVAADSAAGDYDETDLPVSSNWSRNQYYNEPGYGADE